MSGQLDRQPQNEIDGLYYHLITAPERDRQPNPNRLAAPETAPDPDYEYHPDDLADLVRWEKKTNSNIALWLLLMTVVTTVIVPFAPLFTPMVAVFFTLMSAFFYLRGKSATDTQVEQTLDWNRQVPVMQWMGASSSLTIGAVVYLFAIMVPYSAVPFAVQALLFLIAMNFVLYTPVAIMRTIRQRTLRKKVLHDDDPESRLAD